jgi:hypothetical protein
MEKTVIYDNNCYGMCRHCGSGSYTVRAKLYICSKCKCNNIVCKIKYEYKQCMTPDGNDELVEEQIEVTDNDNWENEIKDILPKYRSYDADAIIEEVRKKLTEIRSNDLKSNDQDE